MGTWNRLLEALDRGAEAFQRWFGHDTEMLHYTSLPEHPEPWADPGDVNQAHKGIEYSSFGGRGRAVQ